MRAQSLTVLVVADLYVLPYKVLFCLRDAGIRNVYVLANRRGSARLRYTRFYKRLFTTDTHFDGSDNARALDEINAHVKQLGIDVVIPGDQHSTRMLVRIQSGINTSCFPLPDEASFNLLYNKWDFQLLCRKQNVACPDGLLHDNADTLMEKITSGEVAYPAICKPINLEAGNGILKIEARNAVSQAQRIYYQPVLVQRFIEGEDIGASVYCEKGAIRHFIAHHFKRQQYHTFYNAEIYNAIAGLLGPLGVSGVYNFDMRRSPEGKIYFIECNPRFFAKMIMSALAGINFVAAGLGLPTRASVPDGTAVKMPKLFGLTLLTTPHRLSRADILTTYKLAADPLPFAGELFRTSWSDIETPVNYYHESQ